MSLRYDQIHEIIKIIDASNCEELVLETSDLKLSVRRRVNGHQPVEPAPARHAAPTASLAASAPASAPAPAGAAPTAGGMQEVRAPMVGTFFRAPSPDAPPFVEVGSLVEAGQPLCVIEVMKLFTTIFAEQAGRIAQINATNGELVEYDRVLFVMDGAA